MGAHWLKSRLKEIGESQATLANALGVAAPRISEIIHGKRRILFAEGPKIAKFLGWSMTELQRHAGVDLETGPAEAESEPAPGMDGDEGRAVPEIDVRGGLGLGGEALAINHRDEHGNVVSADDLRAVWRLPAGYLLNELGTRPGATRIFEVEGDSMTPTLQSGDRVMVDTSRRGPTPPSVYANKGKTMVAEVGKDPDPYYRERGPIIAIFPGDPLCVCLPERGFSGPDPVYVGASSILSMDFFAPSSPDDGRST